VPTILVVEGRTDAALFRELFDRLYPQQISAAVRDGEGKYQTSGIVRGLLRTGTRDLVVSQDIDDDTPDNTVTSLLSMVCSHLNVPVPSGPHSARHFAVADRTIGIIPVGLYEDPSLRALGVSQHALEDYLIKLFLEDAGLRENVPELGSLVLQILPAIREKDGPFDKSKELFQLIKPLVQHGFSDTGVVEKVVKDGDEGVLRSVLAPLLADVEQAFGLHS